MMKKLISAIALTVAFAMPSVAATLNGTFTIDIRNFAAGGSSADSAATAENFGEQESDALITYTGNIDFFNTADSGDTTTIAQFLNSAVGGSYVLVNGSLEALNARLSQGTYVTTTFFKITGTLASAVVGTIRHDDGITLVANGQTGGVSAPPTTVRVTPFTASHGDFTLYYAAANGNPSILKVDVAAVPVPAAGFLLLGALGGLAALRRRKTA
jgi:hypothetical protein